MKRIIATLAVAWGDLLKPEEVEALWAYVISN